MTKKRNNRWRHQGYYLKKTHAENVAEELRLKGYKTRILKRTVHDGARKRTMYDVDFKGRKKRSR